MDKDRTVLEDVMKRITEQFGKTESSYKQQEYEIDRDQLFLEILLDIRDELIYIRRLQGHSKWSSHL